MYTHNVVRNNAVEHSLPNLRVVSSNLGCGTSSSPGWKWVAKLVYRHSEVSEKGDDHPTLVYVRLLLMLIVAVPATPRTMLF